MTSLPTQRTGEPEDPARRPGQPGADEAPGPTHADVDRGTPPPGQHDERQIPLDTIRDRADPGTEEALAAPPALSDGSTRAGPA
jgi:hypothetical protein